MLIPWLKGDIPALTAEQMVEVDRAMIEDYHIDLIQMMENAGRHLAQLATLSFLGSPVGKTILVLAGTGGNSGGALAAARHLANGGARINVVLSQPFKALKPAPAQQLDTLKRMGVVLCASADIDTFSPPDLIVDGIIGYNLNGNPHGGAADLIHWANQQPAPTLSLDVPSGVESTTGQLFRPTIKATATMTLALPKTGLNADTAKPYVGELYLADISVPPRLYRQALGIEVDTLFSTSSLLRLR